MVGESEEKNCPATDFQLISQFSQYHKAKQQCTHIFHVKTCWPACHAPPLLFRPFKQRELRGKRAGKR